MRFKYCPRYSVSLKTTDNSSLNPMLLYRARCKMWECPYCAVINQKVWRARIMCQVENNPTALWFFWTITLDGGDHVGDTVASLVIWREKWEPLMKRIKRDIGKINYVRIFETHKDGTLHVHMLADGSYNDVVVIMEHDGRGNYYSESFNKHLDELGLGWRHDIRPIITTDTSDNGNARNVSAYVTKYLTKDLQSGVRKMLALANAKRVRMIQTSTGWAKTETSETDREWEVGAIRLTEFEIAINNDISVLDVDTKLPISYDDFYDEEHYPNKTGDLLDRYNQGESNY